MKTTVEISDALLSEARAVAAREKTTLRALLMRGCVSRCASVGVRRFTLRRVTFTGEEPAAAVAARRVVGSRIRELA
jgi:hypothetical protein